MSKVDNVEEFSIAKDNLWQEKFDLEQRLFTIDEALGSDLKIDWKRKTLNLVQDPARLTKIAALVGGGGVGWEFLPKIVEMFVG